MADITRRGILYGSAGVVAASADAEETSPDPAATFRTGATRVEVDAFGARGDTPASGSTAGATDDSDAIEAALRACPDGGVVVFTPGRCYGVSRQIRVLGKRIDLEATGAIIRCLDDTVWNVFVLGGESSAAMIEEVHVRGGTWDGNLSHQRYWPNTDGTTIFTDRGQEAFGVHEGRPFYENSPINGRDWREGWLDGSAGDGIDVNGGGNLGLIRVQNVRRLRFHMSVARDYVRNAFAAWNCADVVFHHCSSEGQLPTAYFELMALFGKGYEASFMKVAGENTESAPLRGKHAHSVRVIGGRVIGGAMPFFMRIQSHKPISSGSFCHIDGFEAQGIAREVWFEDCSSVRISNSQIVCHPARDSTHRRDPAVFFSNRTHDWRISGCYIRGRINTNENQQRRFGIVEASVIDCEADLGDWVVRCDTIADSIVTSGGWGALCRTASQSEFYAEANAALYVQDAASGCRIGAPRRAGTVEAFALQPGGGAVTLAGAPAGFNHVRIRNPDVAGGRWYDIHASNYHLSSDVLTLRDSDGPFRARAGDELQVSWYTEDAPSHPYAGLRCRTSGGAATEIDAIVENARRSRISGDATLRGQYLDIEDETVFIVDDGASLSLDGVIVKRAAGAIVATQKKAATPRLVIRNCWFEDWGCRADIFDSDDYKRPLAKPRVRDLLQLTGTTFLRTPAGQGHPAGGINDGTVAQLVLGDNVFLGGAKPLSLGGTTEFRKPDYS